MDNNNRKPVRSVNKGRKTTGNRNAKGGKQIVKNGRRTSPKGKVNRGRKRVGNGKSSTPTVKIAFLGGLNEIGKNITLFECCGDMFILDCGMAFPDGEMLGVDLVLPDFTYVKENISKIKGIVITHGHEDHIGSLPYLLKDCNIPVYGTPLTMGLVGNKLKEHNLVSSARLNVVNAGDVVKMGCMDVELIHVNHSIPDSVGVAIHTPAGTLVHTGDFKIDCTPAAGTITDLTRFAELGKEGVLALMADSTNAERPGYTKTEAKVQESFERLFVRAQNRRIIIATFASNINRIQQIVNCAYANNRKVAFSGRSMLNYMQVATELGYVDVPQGVIIDIDSLNQYTPEQIVLVTTGSQGESMAALSRMAANIHKKITIKPNDAIIFSSHPIPGNEKAVSKVINELSMKGAKVIFQDVHVSGHACQEEIKLIYSLVRPKYAIPVHGEYRHLIAQARVAEELGIDKDNIFILSSGDVLELDEESAAVTGKVHTGAIMVDGLGVGDVGNIVLRDRQHLAEDGIIIVVLTLEGGSGQVLAGPDTVSRGFVYVRGAETLMEEAKQVLDERMQYCMDKGITDWGKIKTEIKDSLSDFVWKETKRRPMIMPIIMEV